MAAPTVSPAAQPAAGRREWTVAEVLALPAPKRRGTKYELIDGELLVTPAPFIPHGRVIMELTTRVKAYVDVHALGETFNVPADLMLNDRSVVQPDMFVLPPGEAPPLPEFRWDRVKRVLLAAEVISRGSRRADRIKKRRHYQQYGVGEYWIVDTTDRTFEVWNPADERPALLHEWLVWRPRLGDWAPDVPPFELDLAEFFLRALGPSLTPEPEEEDL